MNNLQQSILAFLSFLGILFIIAAAFYGFWLVLDSQNNKKQHIRPTIEIKVN